MELVRYVQSLHLMIQSTDNPIYVLGNTSADYDSIIGSIIYAFMLTSIMNINHIPVIDCKMQDLALRFEVTYLLEKLGIQSKHLVFFDQINWNEKTQFILYDHNSRQEQLNIQKIVDHHDMSQINPQKHLIYPAGSGLTILWFMLNPNKLALIENSEFLLRQLQTKGIEPLSQKIRHFLQLGVTFNSFSRPIEKYDHLVDQLIRYGILLDSVGFAEKNRQRWTFYDKFAVEQIQRQYRQNGKGFLISFYELDQIKFDQQLSAKLSLQDHLRKDYKYYLHELTTVEESYVSYFTKQNKKNALSLYSIVYMEPEAFISRYNSDGSLRKILERKIQQHQHIDRIHLTSYTILFSYKSIDKPKKDILIYSESRFFKQKIVSVLQKMSIKTSKKQLGLADHNWALLTDQNGTVSRKKITKAMNHQL